VLDRIGDTPMIRINALSADLDCELLAKVRAKSILLSCTPALSAHVQSHGP
jgi:cysteine synthase